MTNDQKQAVLMSIFHTTSGTPFIPESEYREFTQELRDSVEAIASPCFGCGFMSDASVWVLRRSNDDESALLDTIGYEDRE